MMIPCDGFMEVSAWGSSYATTVSWHKLEVCHSKSYDIFQNLPFLFVERALGFPWAGQMLKLKVDVKFLLPMTMDVNF